MPSNIADAPHGIRGTPHGLRGGGVGGPLDPLLQGWIHDYIGFPFDEILDPKNLGIYFYFKGASGELVGGGGHGWGGGAI